MGNIHNLDELKIILRESDIPFFSDNELTFYLNKNDGSYENTAYECLMIKSKNTTLTIAGLTAADSSSYFRRLASQYRPNNSGFLQGGY